jgi:MFS transporter, DHA3 family, macrolide efflux protein
MFSLRLTGMPAFTLVWIGQFISLTGSALMRFAVGVWLFEQTGLATTFTAMIFFSSLPRVLLSPVAGALVDRWNRKVMMMVSDLATGCLTIIIFLLIRSDSLEIWHLYALGALSSAFEAFQFPAYSSAITLMVDKKHYARTSAMLALADDSSRVLAPVLAAVLVSVIHLEGIVLLDILSFAAAIGILLLIPIPQPESSETGKKAGRGFWKEITYGFRYMWQTPALLGLQINFLAVNLMLGMSTVLRTPLVLARTGNDEVALGIVASVMAAGGVIGGLVMSVWGGPKRRIHGVLGGIILMSLGRAVLGLGQEVIAWSIGGFLVLFFISVCNASNQAIWQAKTPADVQGRVFAARRFTGQLTFPIAVLISGPLSDRWFEPAMAADGFLAPVFGGLVGTGPGAGMSLLILLTAVIGLIVPIASYAVPALRNIEDHIPDSEVTAAAPAY